LTSPDDLPINPSSADQDSAGARDQPRKMRKMRKMHEKHEMHEMREMREMREKHEMYEMYEKREVPEICKSREMVAYRARW
jgi:hypothetical protein